MNRGFTLIELLTTIGIMVALMAGAAGAMLPALRRSQVENGAESIAQVVREARVLAMNRTPAAGSTYGVVIVGRTATAPAYAAVTYGATVAVSTILTEDGTAGGRPVCRRELPASLQLIAGSDAAAEWSGTIAFALQPRTGSPIPAPPWPGTASAQEPIYVGAGYHPVKVAGVLQNVEQSLPTDASPVVRFMAVATVDGAQARRLVVHPVGIVAATPVTLP